MTAFETCMAFLLEQEGGYVNHPDDPGGPTNLGVTVATWRAWIHEPVTIADMKALTRADVAPLYRVQYWNTIDGDQLPPALAMCVFDFGVNASPQRAARMLQDLVGATADGHIGPATCRAVQQFVAAHGLPELVRQYQQARRAYYRSLPTFRVFGRGWLNRVDKVESKALKLC